MTISHINKITYDYTAGGVTTSKTVEVTESDGAEINLSHPITTDSSTETTDIDLLGFEFTLKAKAYSTYFLLTGFDGSLYANDSSSGTLMVALEDGIPYVWSDNSDGNFPPGAANKLVDGTVSLAIKPDAGSGTGTPGTITIKVLYDPE